MPQMADAGQDKWSLLSVNNFEWGVPRQTVRGLMILSQTAWAISGVDVLKTFICKRETFKLLTVFEHQSCCSGVLHDHQQRWVYVLRKIDG